MNKGPLSEAAKIQTAIEALEAQPKTLGDSIIELALEHATKRIDNAGRSCSRLHHSPCWHV